jgi:hypothetical protein
MADEVVLPIPRLHNPTKPIRALQPRSQAPTRQCAERSLGGYQGRLYAFLHIRDIDFRY